MRVSVGLLTGPIPNVVMIPCVMCGALIEVVLRDGVLPETIGCEECREIYYLPDEKHLKEGELCS